MKLTESLLESVKDVIEHAVNDTCRRFPYLSDESGRREVLSEAYMILANAAEKYDSQELKFVRTGNRNAGFRTYLDRCLSHIAYNIRRHEHIREVPMTSSDDDSVSVFEQEWTCSRDRKSAIDGFDTSRLSDGARALADAIVNGELDVEVRNGGSAVRYSSAARVQCSRAVEALRAGRVEHTASGDMVARNPIDADESLVRRATREIREGIRLHCKRNMPSDSVFLAAIGA